MLCEETDYDYDYYYSCGLGFIVMGCLFRCFRLSDPTPPHSDSNKNTDRIVSRNRLASLLVSERDDEKSACKDTKTASFDANSIIEGELRDEARFLKSCGTLLETPLEIRQASERVKDSLPYNEHSESSKFHSWLPTTSIDNLHSEAQMNQSSNSHVKLYNDLGKESVCPSTPEVPALPNQCENRSVHFEFESDRCSPSTIEHTKKSNSSGSCNEPGHSPYLTPLKLSDEMQTPGTVYPMSSHGENARISSQYVSNVLNPIQDYSQLMALKNIDYNNHKQFDSIAESLEKSEDACSQSSCVSNEGKENSSGKEIVNASLSHWMKPSSMNDRVQNCQPASSGGSNSCKKIDMDRPILGTVAAHWNEEEPSRISPKWWDGNGIPNSTNKYKEDQKVSWHAVPFEERLEKALSNESLVSQRKLSPETIRFVENEESDTAISQLQSSKQPESVVSF